VAITPAIAMAINSHMESGNTTCDYPDIFGSEFSGHCLPVTHEGRAVGTTGPTECHGETCEAVIGHLANLGCRHILAHSDNNIHDP